MIRQISGVGVFLFFASLKSYDYFGEENACFFNSQTACQKTRISFCIWATELESGISSSNTYSSTRPNRARDVELNEVDIELNINFIVPRRE